MGPPTPRLPAVTIATAILAAACTGGEETTPTTTTAAVTTTLAPTTVPDRLTDLEFADLLATRDPSALDAGRALVVPGSAADRYLTHQIIARRALPAAEAASTRPLAGGASVCDTPTSCVLIGDLVLDPTSGLVRSFSIDGISIDDRVTGPGPGSTVDNVTVSVRSAALTADDALVVTLEVRNESGSGVEWFGFAATYTSGDGSTVEATGAWGPTEVLANSIETLVIAFPAATLPGGIDLTGLRDDDIDLVVDVDLPSPG